MKGSFPTLYRVTFLFSRSWTSFCQQIFLSPLYKFERFNVNFYFFSNREYRNQLYIVSAVVHTTTVKSVNIASD